jgi:hypothetical protein
MGESVYCRDSAIFGGVLLGGMEGLDDSSYSDDTVHSMSTGWQLDSFRARKAQRMLDSESEVSKKASSYSRGEKFGKRHTAKLIRQGCAIGGLTHPPPGTDCLLSSILSTLLYRKIIYIMNQTMWHTVGSTYGSGPDDTQTAETSPIVRESQQHYQMMGIPRKQTPMLQMKRDIRQLAHVARALNNYRRP